MSVLAPAIAELAAPGAPFEVVEEEIHSVVQRTYKNRPTDLRELIATALEHGDAEHLVQGDTRLTFTQAFTRSLQIARTLHDEWGVRPGHRVAILGSNAPDWVVTFWAAVALDAVVVPFNAWWQDEELAFGLDDSGTTFLFADPHRAVIAEAAGLERERIAVWGERMEGWVHVDDLAVGQPAPLDLVATRGEDETAAILYTSGTTGRPKGSANTTRNIISNLMNAALARTAYERAVPAAAADPEQLVELCVVPLFHATANFSYVIPFAYAGAKFVFMPSGRFDPEVAGRLIEAERVTRIGGVPTIVSRVIDSGIADRYDLSSLAAMSYGGAPASKALMDKIAASFPDLREKVSQGYGLTETSAISTLNIGPDYAAKPSSVGIAMPIVELAIMDPDGVSLPTGDTGEVWIRGANVIPGYWNRPDANHTQFHHGYLKTGDVGYMDEEGFLFITDRAKDMVIRGGENVYSAEVEAVIEAHPAVVEVAVVGVPHVDLGEQVKAVVVIDTDVTTDELAAHVSEHLASFKVPEVWELTRDLLPRNPSGKVLKQALRGGHSAVFAVGEESDSAL